MITEFDVKVGAKIKFNGNEGEIVAVDPAASGFYPGGKVSTRWDVGGLAGRICTDSMAFVTSQCDLVTQPIVVQPAPVGGFNVVLQNPASQRVPWAVGDVCYRNDVPLISDEMTSGVTHGCRGVIVKAAFKSWIGSTVVEVRWDCENTTRHYAVENDQCKITRTPPAQAPQAVAQPASPWVLGVHVERNAERYDYGGQSIDRVALGARGEIVGKQTTGMNVDWIRVRWADGHMLQYIHPERFMRIVAGPRKSDGCTRCAKRWIYEPPPGGVCAECKIVEAML